MCASARTPVYNFSLRFAWFVEVVVVSAVLKEARAAARPSARSAQKSADAHTQTRREGKLSSPRNTMAANNSGQAPLANFVFGNKI